MQSATYDELRDSVSIMHLLTPTREQLQEDVCYLTARARRCGIHEPSTEPSWSPFANALVAAAYGEGAPTPETYPDTEDDLLAAERAISGLPQHRQTAPVLTTLRYARMRLEPPCP